LTKIDEKLSDAARGWSALDGEARMFDAAVYDEKVRAEVERMMAGSSTASTNTFPKVMNLAI
jgi:hypothetical protein